MTHFLISGYFGFDNSGDEAILKSIVASLKNIFPQVNITVLSNNPQKTAASYQVRAVNRWKLAEISAALKQCDCLISGGGSLLQDVTGIKSLGYYLGVISLAKFFRKPVFFYAQGIGPVGTGLGRFLVKTVVNKVNFITVRDHQSEIDLREMGVIHPRISVTADPVLAMPPCSEVKHLKMVSVCVRPWHHGKKSYQAIAEMCDDFIDEGYKVCFIPFQYQTDSEISQDIISLMKNDAYLPEGPLSIDEISCAIACSEVVIGMRYHALVLSAANQVPFVGIEYDPKVTRFLKQCSMPSAGKPENVTVQSLRQALRILYTQKEKTDKMLDKVSQLREQALKTTELLYKFMNGDI